ncbi:cell surface protein [Campylobacter helveticus]|nr:cell surface protein [Campylobacter helveticus]
MIMQTFDLGENLTLIHYSVFEKEDDFRGNISFWNQMLKQSIIMKRSKMLKNAYNEIKIRFIRSCKRRKVFFTKKIESDLDATQL